MMLTVEDLLMIEKMPRESEVSLQLLQQFYKLHLCDRIYVFELDDGEEIKFVFEEANLCHLLGLQHILKARRFQGQSGYELIAEGVVTLTFLKEQNKVGYKSKKQRILYFPFVYQMIFAPVLIEYKGAGVETRMDYELIVYHAVEQKYLHLGLRQYDRSEFYYPVSFFEDGRDRYVSGQSVIVVKSVRVDQEITIRQ